VYFLDTNIFREYLNGNESVIVAISAKSYEEIFISTIIVEEILAGSLALIQKLRTQRRLDFLENAHRLLQQNVTDLQCFQILSYNGEAEQAYRELPASIKRIGPQDCRLAVHAMAHNGIIVTKNTADFQAIGVRCEDWTIP
jgi:predicted nucleic acid-binding protein